MMTKDYGIPEWACYIIFAIATILLGLILGLVSTYTINMSKDVLFVHCINTHSVCVHLHVCLFSLIINFNTIVLIHSKNY